MRREVGLCASELAKYCRFFFLGVGGYVKGVEGFALFMLMLVLVLYWEGGIRRWGYGC